MRGRVRSLFVCVLATCLLATTTPATAGLHDNSAYHSYAEMRKAVAKLAQRFDTVHRFSIGTSHEGRKLWGVRISDDASDNKTEPGVLYVGGHHAREHMSVEVAIKLARYFAAANKPAVRRLVKDRQIYIIFDLNPDGSEFDISGKRYRSWRKNRQPNAGSNCRGIDLNRNYSYRWGSTRNLGRPCSIEYKGPSPFSAPETAALKSFIEDHTNITAAIAYHSYGGEVLFPYGYTTKKLPGKMQPYERRTLSTIAGKMARKSGFVAMQSGKKYLTPGDFIDWAFGDQGIYAFTVELSGNTFYPPDTAINSEFRRNRGAAQYLAKVSKCPEEVVGRAC